MRKFFALFLSATMIFSLTACKDKASEHQDSSIQATGEYIYVPEFYTLIPEESTSESITQFAMGADRIYMIHNTFREKGTAKQDICYYSIDNLKERICFLSSENFMEEDYIINLTCIISDKHDNLYMAYLKQPTIPDSVYKDENISWENYLKETEQDSGLFLAKYSAEGELLYTHNVTSLMKDDQGMYFNKGIVDDNGNLYFIGNNGCIIRFSENGSDASIINLGSNNSISAIGILPDGNIGVNVTGRKSEIKVINVATEKVDKTYSNLPSNLYNTNISYTEDEKILLSNSDGIFAYDPITQEDTQLLKWLDLDVIGNFVQASYALADGNFLIVYTAQNVLKPDLILLRKTDAATVVSKEIITLGCFGISQSVQNDVMEFNKENEKYRIVVKDYMDGFNWSMENADALWDEARIRFSNDIISGNTPDMFITNVLSPEVLVQKGIVEDLGPYLDKSATFKREDFFASVLTANTYNGVLYNIPSLFIIDTIFARTEDVSEYKEWTLDSLLSLCEKYPDAALKPNASRSEILYLLVMSSLDSYVNMETGECRFDSEDFKKILQICKKYPREIDWENDYVITPEALQTHTALLYSTGLGDIDSYVTANALYDCPVTNVGYPGKGVLISSEGIYISAKSKHKDICFSFIERTLSEESVLKFMNYGFPSNKAVFDKQIEERLHNPGEHTLGYGDYDKIVIKVPRPTRADAIALMELIEQASKKSTYDEAVFNILIQETDPYFAGQKSMDEVISIIQNRVKLYVNESR